MRFEEETVMEEPVRVTIWALKRSSLLFLAALWTVAACIVLIAGLMFLGVAGPGKATIGLSVRQKAKNVASEPAVVIKPGQLMSDYEGNEVAADAKYKNRLLAVTGPIEEVGKDVREKPYVAIGAGNPVFTIQCFFESNEELARAGLKKGSLVSIVGRCYGEMGNVFLEKCVLQRKGQPEESGLSLWPLGRWSTAYASRILVSLGRLKF